MHTKYKRLQIIISVIIIAMILTFGFMIYDNALENSFSSYSHTTMREVMQQQTHSFKTLIHERLSSIKTLDKVFTNDIACNNNNEVLLKTLKSAKHNSDFRRLLLADLDGKALSSDNVVVDISQQEFFLQAKAGKTFVSKPLVQALDDKTVIVFSTPVYSQGKITGVLAGVYDSGELGKAFTSFYDKAGYSYIYTANGEFVTKAADIDLPQDALSLLSDAKFVKYDNFQEILQKAKAGESGHSIYKINGQTRLLHYAPVDVNDWYIFTIVTDEAISRESRIISNHSLFLIIFIVLVVAGILSFFLWRQKRSADIFYQTAYFDKMTGIPNLEKFKLDAARLLKSNTNAVFYVLKFDIHQFKMVNELYGMNTGDNVIKAIASVIAKLASKPQCIFARVNADEFIVLDFYGNSEEMEADRLLFEREVAKVDLSLTKGHNIHFRYGRYVLKKGECNVDAILEKVNLAHRLAREQKQEVVFDYNDAIKEQLVRESELESMMESALVNEEFVVYLQPKYNIKSETVVGAEALARWKRGDEFIAYPNQFIPLFEKNGFILKLDMYMLRKVCEIIRGWIDEGKQVVPISINFSRLHLARDNFVALIEEVVNKYEIPKKYIEVELTESSMFGNEKRIQAILSKLHEAGFTLSIDDFGTGYSSLGLLKNLPVDTIKIDRSFFDDNQYKTRAKIVIESVIQMAKKLNVNIVAEGVEDTEHIKILREVGCEIVQGYYYARPMPAGEFAVDSSKYLPTRERHNIKLEYADIGDLTLGRTKLGENMPVAVYRLYQFALRMVLKEYYGEGEMIRILRRSGRLAGSTFAREALDVSLPLAEFVEQLAAALEANKIGVLRVESFDADTGKGILSIYDDLDCSGITKLNETLCQYDEGFIAGILYEYTKKKYSVVEIECWGTGGNLCRFEVKPK